MKKECALYRSEKKGDGEYRYVRQTQYVRREG